MTENKRTISDLSIGLVAIAVVVSIAVLGIVIMFKSFLEDRSSQRECIVKVSPLNKFTAAEIDILCRRNNHE